MVRRRSINTTSMTTCSAASTHHRPSTAPGPDLFYYSKLAANQGQDLKLNIGLKQNTRSPGRRGLACATSPTGAPATSRGGSTPLDTLKITPMISTAHTYSS